MQRLTFLVFFSLSTSLLCFQGCFAQTASSRRVFDCVGAWRGAAPVKIEIVDGKLFQNGEEMRDASIGPDKISYNKRDGADLFVTTILPSKGSMTISVFQSPRKEEQAFLEGKCHVKP
jgi:hypothetical protein